MRSFCRAEPSLGLLLPRCSLHSGLTDSKKTQPGHVNDLAVIQTQRSDMAMPAVGARRVDATWRLLGEPSVDNDMRVDFNGEVLLVISE